MNFTNTKGRTSFESYYSHLFPDLDLQNFFTQKHPPVLLIHPQHRESLKSAWSSHNLSCTPLPWYPYAIVWPKEVPFGTKLPGFDSHLIYPLNPASLLPVLSLDVKGSDLILDACAAPGGKSLAIANLLYPNTQNLLSNDSSPARFISLKRVLKNFGYSNIETRNLALQKLQYSGLQFDKILLDAPCSSEKHVFTDPKERARWSPNRIKKLSHQQFVLIKSTLPLLKPNGTLVYSTCALTPEENEAVVASTLSKLPLTLQNPVTLPYTQPGLPNYGLNTDQIQQVVRINENSQGFDPMFVARFQKYSYQ